MARNKALYFKYMIPRKKGSIIRLVLITVILSTLIPAWWLSKSTSEALLLPLPNQELDHFRLNRSLKSYLDSIDLLIEPSSTVCSDKYDVPILVLVTSSPTRFDQREAIRNTWGKKLPTYFILGLNGTCVEDLMVDNYVEAKKYSDIVIYNFKDHYQNLTLKTALILKWVSMRCPKILSLFKTDDDVMVNPWMLRRVIQETYGSDLVGYKKMNNYLHRDEYNKWYLPRWLYRNDYISEYLSGTGYLINGIHILKILYAAFDVPMINLEDVYFTYLVSKDKLGLKLTHDNRLSPYKPWLPLGCMYSGLASAHSLTPEEMLAIWPTIQDLEQKNSCENFINKYWSEIFLY